MWLGTKCPTAKKDAGKDGQRLVHARVRIPVDVCPHWLRVEPETILRYSKLLTFILTDKDRMCYM